MSIAAAEALLALVIALTPAAGWERSHCADAPLRVQALSRAALIAAGRSPAALHPQHHEASNLGALCRVLRGESGGTWADHAYAEGWVGRCVDGSPAWNRSRGIAQLGSQPCWWSGSPPTDEQAFNAAWSILWLASEPERSTTVWYPETGIEPTVGRGRS